MVQRVQVSHSIRDRQIYQTLVKMDKALGDATRFIVRGEGTQAVADASGNNGANVAVVETLIINTGYVLPTLSSADRLDYLLPRIYNPEWSTLSGDIGFEDGIFLINSNREVTIVADVIAGTGAYSWTNMTVDWILLEVKP